MAYVTWRGSDAKTSGTPCQTRPVASERTPPRLALTARLRHAADRSVYLFENGWLRSKINRVRSLVERVEWSCRRRTSDHLRTWVMCTQTHARHRYTTDRSQSDMWMPKHEKPTHTVYVHVTLMYGLCHSGLVDWRCSEKVMTLITKNSVGEWKYCDVKSGRSNNTANYPAAKTTRKTATDQDGSIKIDNNNNIYVRCT